MQWHDTGWFGLVFTLVLVFFILYNISKAKKGKKEMYLRRIAGLNAIDEAIGRATEMGKPVLMVPGIGDVAEIGVQAQAIAIFGYIARTVAKFASPMRLCVATPAAYTLAQEVIRDAYQAEGQLERFDPDSVQFVTDAQFAFAAGVSGMIHRDRTAACFFMGPFFAESLIFAETANSVGAIQIAASTQNTQTPFFIAACDYVLIGDEFYAASAYLSREPIRVGSLTGQDWCKMLVAATLLVGLLAVNIQRQMVVTQERQADGTWVPLAELYPDDPAKSKERKMLAKETALARLWNPVEAVRGSPMSASYDSLPAYLAARRAELGATADAVAGAEEKIGGKTGNWYQWTVGDGGVTRHVDDFVAASDPGVQLLRSYRSRPQRQAEPVAAATDTGGGS